MTNLSPTSLREMQERGWDEADVILFTGDAYVDHPSFGTAVIARVLESMEIKVAVVPQPNWQDDLRDFRKLGRPRLFFGVTAGAMDSMLCHYTAFRKKRRNDAYTPGGRTGARPDYPTIEYTKILKQLFPDVPVVLGGIEASLRRFTHYDYWQNKLRPSILVDSGADMLVYGMGEAPIQEIVRLLERGVPFQSINTVPQTAFLVNEPDDVPKNKKWRTIELYSHRGCLDDKKTFAENFVTIETESNRMEQARLVQATDDGIVVVNPAMPRMDSEALDRIYDLPFTRKPHPRYRKKEPIPAWDMIKDSITIHRGCFGGCSFCTISAHQSKFVTSRSEESVLRETRLIAEDPDFKGHITDLGGPSANMYGMKGRDNELCRKCNRPSCAFPEICPNLDTSHARLLELYRRTSSVPGVNRITIGSGIRYDLIPDSDREYLRELVTEHVSGRLKVAPEHSDDRILRLMRKPDFSLYRKFEGKFRRICDEYGLKQQVIPYFISSHPGCRETDMAELSVELKGLHIEQVQDFTPTPMTLSAVMYYTGFDPYNGEEIFVARNIGEKRAQKDYFFMYNKDVRKKVLGRLKKLGRNDLIKRLGL